MGIYTANSKMLGHFEVLVMLEKQPFLVRCSDTPLVIWCWPQYPGDMSHTWPYNSEGSCSLGLVDVASHVEMMKQARFCILGLIIEGEDI